MSRPNTVSLDDIIEGLEDTFSPQLTRRNHYHDLLTKLKNEKNLSVPTIDRLLAICVHDLKEDFKFTTNALSVISSILTKWKFDRTTLHNLVLSAKEVLRIMKITASLNNVDTLQSMSFSILMMYPQEVLVALATSEMTFLFEVLEVLCTVKVDNSDNDHVYNVLELLGKLLKALSDDQKGNFVKEGLALWFSCVIPTAVTLLQNNLKAEKYLEVIELLTETLVHIDYAENPHWKVLIERIYNPQKYPAIMKKLLENKSNYWHRLWIIFIKLLKTQITKVNNATGSPINSMLPVVELAFKMDPTSRCRAFLCWNVLIDNFSMEVKESYMNKQIRLLIVPLTSSNAKVVVTAVAKLNTWWHLIRQFHSKIDKYVNIILIPFLHFCFGKPNAKTTVMVPGQLSNETKRQCLQALVEIFGHVDCEGCGELPKLKSKIITTKLLVDYWKDWIHSLKVAILTSTSIHTEITRTQVTCLWKSFVLVITELPDNNIRKDLFSELLSEIAILCKESEHNMYFAEIMFDVLIKSLFDYKHDFKQLLKTSEEDQGPMQEVLLIIMNPVLDNYYNGKNTKATEVKFLTKTIMTKSVGSPDLLIRWILKNLPQTNIGFMLWSALAESIRESKYQVPVPELQSMLLWPLKSMESTVSANDSMTWYNWLMLYNLVRPEVNGTSIDTDIFNILAEQSKKNSSPTTPLLTATLAILKEKLLNGNNKEYEQAAEILLKIMNRDQFYNKEIFPILVDVLVLMVNKVTETIQETLMKHATEAVKIVLNVMATLLENQKDDRNILAVVDVLLQSLKDLFNIEAYSQFKRDILEQLIKLTLCVEKESSTMKNVILILKSVLSSLNEGDSLLYKMAKTVIDAFNNQNDCDNIIMKSVNLDMEKNSFTAPDSNLVSKKSKKKETSIVNTVVENGEEFVVVKSHWKFNPKKLTENQKEKLKRKREDIPALYQDLSQSQDEFKLTAWKTDSQDTSTTSSKSTSKSANEDISTILNKMPSTEVVPKIIENLLTGTVNTVDKDGISNAKNILKVPDSNVNILQQTLSPKDSKSPRLALKDRVFRNVRNLIEKSGLQNENKLKLNETNEMINKAVITTPPSKKFTMNSINSAPPKISSERPSRVIKKPKKFDDLELIPVKKRRRSQNDVQIDSSQNESQPEFEQNYKTNQESIVSEDANKIRNKIITQELTPKETVSIINETKEIQNELIPGVCNETSAEKEKELAEQIIDNTEISKNKIKTATQVNETLMVSNDPSADISVSVSDSQETSTPNNKTKDINDQKSSAKKKRSRIEKQLLIDMVEGHPFLQVKSEKRVTRKTLLTPENNRKRKSLAEKHSIGKQEPKNTTKHDKKIRDKDKSEDISKSASIVIVESEEIHESSEDIPHSEDFIESSQDSTITTISVASTKQLKKTPIVKLDHNIDTLIRSKLSSKPPGTQQLEASDDIIPLSDNLLCTSKEDIEFPRNKIVEEQITLDLTENIDSEPIKKMGSSSDVIIINDDETPIHINTDDTFKVQNTQEVAEADTQPATFKGQNTQEVAEADTQPNDTLKGENTQEIVELDTQPNDTFQEQNTQEIAEADTQPMDSELILVHDDQDYYSSVEQIPVNEESKRISNNVPIIDNQQGVVKTISGSLELSTTENGQSNEINSPFKDENQRKKDFLNDTIEISPIKTLSPLREEKQTTSPETSNDYLVIKLGTPVQSNGEPIEKCDSPEIFTEDKISPDKRDQSPPRAEVIVNNTSPSSSLSLKKNRPQMRSIGRAAQMLGLCAPDKLQAIMNSERSNDIEEAKKSSSLNTPARRNLRILYNSVGENNESPDESEDSENFLKFKRSLPAADCSPSVPILKRKIIEITDDTTISPASKRKRVSFHDPPVSTTIAVQKYIEPGGARSPQSSVLKRQERQLRPNITLKSPKRLDHAFKLDTVLVKTVESFSEDVTITSIKDTELSSLDQTPAVEVVKTSDLNDTDPICPQLLDCKDPIDNIAGELSSPAMKTLFINELEGKVQTIADLAKMTELEVNRLCIKAPKVKTVKKVLTDYTSKKAKAEQVSNVDNNKTTVDVQLPEVEVQKVHVEIQTNHLISINAEVQTDYKPVTLVHTQTDVVPTLHSGVQTDESGAKSTKDIVASCLLERHDFIQQLGTQLEETAIEKIADKLSFNSSVDLVMKKMSTSDSVEILNRILKQQEQNGQKTLSFLQEYMCNRFESKDLILFCSNVLKQIHDKPA